TSILSGGGADACATAETPRRIWRLSDEQYAAVMADLLPGIGSAEISTPGRSKAEFINMADFFPVSGALAASVRSAAKSTAAEAVKDVNKLLQCTTGQAEPACTEAFIDRFGSRAFRRPIEAAEKQKLLQVYAFGAQK